MGRGRGGRGDDNQSINFLGLVGVCLSGQGLHLYLHSCFRFGFLMGISFFLFSFALQVLEFFFSYSVEFRCVLLLRSLDWDGLGWDRVEGANGCDVIWKTNTGD
jgi:hypothetical protein